MNNPKHLSLLLLPLLLLAAGAARAEAEAAPDLSVSSNLNLVSEYRFRGIDQTWGGPALQGGVDLAHRNGLYAGLWASNVSGNSYPGGNLEVDYYAGYNGKLDDDWGYTVGGYGYWYPGANVDKGTCPSAAWAAPCSLPGQKFDNFELNGGFSWRWLSYKLSVSLTDYFGANTKTGYSSDTKGSLYHDLSANVPLAEDLTLNLHLGRTDVKATYGGISADYTDYRLGLTRTFSGGWSLSGAWVGATNDRFYRPPVGGLSAANGETRELNKDRLVLQVGRSF